MNHQIKKILFQVDAALSKDYTDILNRTNLGSVVLSVSAVDRDVRPRNSQFSYSILGGNSKESFEIDPNQGTIRTTKYLDREKVEQYELIIGAIDND